MTIETANTIGTLNPVNPEDNSAASDLGLSDRTIKIALQGSFPAFTDDSSATVANATGPQIDAAATGFTGVQSQVATNTGDIATNAGNIQTNTDNIALLQRVFAGRIDAADPAGSSDLPTGWAAIAAGTTGAYQLVIANGLTTSTSMITGTSTWDGSSSSRPFVTTEIISSNTWELTATTPNAGVAGRDIYFLATVFSA